MTSLALRLCASAVLAGGLTFAVFAALPDELGVQTDIVGYPTHANFDIDRYFWAYGLAVAFFPLVTFALYLLLTRAFVGPQGFGAPIPRPLERVEAVPAASGRQEWAVALGRTIFVGGVLGFEAAIVAAPSRRLGFALTVLGYCAFVGLVAWLGTRIASRDPIDVAGSVNMFAAPITVAGLYGVSESTGVVVADTGAVHAYPWFPAWLALGVTGVLLAWLGVRWVRCPGRLERNALERRALLLVVGPVGLFLFVASLPGALGTFDFFEEGQLLAGSELTRDGAFPWRDLLVTHGLLNDVVQGLVGARVFEDSRWGVVAGNALLVVPLSWVGLYYLCTYLFGANWLFLLGTQLLVVTGHIDSLNTRFALLPFVLLLLVAVLQRPTVVRAVAFTALLSLQVIVTPEALPAAVAYAGTLGLFELYYYEPGRGLVVGFRRVWLCLATALVLAAGWSLFLLAFGALDDWAYSFTTFVSGHRLTGGIPVQVAKTEPEIYVPVVLVLAVVAFVVARTRLRRPLAFQDWAMVATAALTLLYYTKFLSRADAGHLDQSYSVAVPLLFYAAYRGITFGEAAAAKIARARGVTWFPARHTLTVPLLLVLLASAPVAFPDAARAVPYRVADVVVPREPEVERIGFDRPGLNDAAMIRDVARTMESLLEPGDTVFDFSNSPGLFHYLLDLPPSTRYYHVSVAIRQRTQTDLVRLLEDDRPEVVVFTSDGDGRSLPSWDGIANQVRHYDVSEYLLDHYVPVLDSHGFVLMRRRDRGAREHPELYFHVPSCDWGYVPSFSPERAGDAESLVLASKQLPPALSISGWAVDPDARTPAAEVVVTLHGKVVARTRPRLERPDVVAALDEDRYLESGFEIVAPTPLGFRLDDVGLAATRVYAVMRSGVATQLAPVANIELGTDGDASSERLELPGGRIVTVVRDLGAGFVDAASVERLLAVSLPDGAAGYRWLELRTGEPLQEGRLWLADRLETGRTGRRAISFGTLDRGETIVRVMVGACSQWRGYRSGVLYLTSDVPQDIRDIRLAR